MKALMMTEKMDSGVHGDRIVFRCKRRVARCSKIVEVCNSFMNTNDEYIVTIKGEHTVYCLPNNNELVKKPDGWFIKERDKKS